MRGKTNLIPEREKDLQRRKTEELGEKEKMVQYNHLFKTTLPYVKQFYDELRYFKRHGWIDQSMHVVRAHHVDESNVVEIICRSDTSVHSLLLERLFCWYCTDVRSNILASGYSAW